MPPRANRVDIWSMGEVVQHLQELIETEQAKPCHHLLVQRGHADAFYPRCKKDWASWEPAENVALDVTAYNGPREALIYSVSGYNTVHHMDLHGDFLDASTNARRYWIRTISQANAS